jgi:hypothetical protein
MKYIEDVHWILDKPGTTIHNQDEKFKENIAFVHSLGKKCDCVGWSNLRRDDPRAEEILEKIVNFCKENGWTARGLYTREYADFDADWFEIDGAYFKDTTFGEYVSVPAQDGGTVKICSMKAYRELSVAPKSWGGSLYVPERFYNAYRESGMTGLDFCWAKDTGKYAAQQYFEIFGTERIPQVAVAWDLKKQDLRKLGTDGGWLPRLGEVFARWTQLNLPYCYRKEDMPAGGIAYAYIPSTFSCCGLYQVLVHKDVAQQLLQEKAIPTGALKPVPVLDVIPSGYTLRATSICPRPTREYMEQSLLNYDILKKKDRPLWQISEKDALRVLRKVKTDRKEDFGKKLSKAKAEVLTETKYAPMLPYYLIANGGQLSDEYRLLSLDESDTATSEFRNILESEELLEDKPDGIVICACANGDWVLLLRDGTVIRFSHEVPEITEQWPSLAQFIVDAIND